MCKLTIAQLFKAFRCEASHQGSNPYQALVDSQITDRGTCVGGDLGMSVHGCGKRLAVSHTNTLKDIQSILVLLQEEVVVHCRSSRREAVRMMSSMYNNRYPWLALWR
jgi:hypothetical protein